MQSFLTVLGYQFILVFTEYWCKQMPKLPVIFKICRDDWYGGYWLQNHRKLSGAAILPVALLRSPRPQQKMPSPWLSSGHTRTLTRLANDVQLNSPLPSLAHQRPPSYVVSKLGMGEEKEAQLLIHQVLSGGVLYSYSYLLKGADPFWSLGLWTKSRAELPQWSETRQSGSLFPQRIDLWLVFISSIRGKTFLSFLPSMTLSQSFWVLIRQLTNSINMA